MINFRLFSHIFAFHVFDILHSPCNVTFKVFTESRWSDFLLRGVEKTCLEPKFIYFLVLFYGDDLKMCEENVRRLNKQSNKKKKAIRVGGPKCRTCAALWPTVHPQENYKGLSGKYRETRNSCLLSVENLNGSRHLVFWSLGTLTGLRDRVRRLVV